MSLWGNPLLLSGGSDAPDPVPGTALLSPYGAASYRLVGGRVLTGFHKTYGYLAPADAAGNWRDFDWSGAWEIGCAFSQGDTSGNFTLFGELNSTSRFADVPGAELAGATLGRGISTAGATTWSNWYNFSGVTISADKWFFFRMAYDPSTMTLTSALSDDFSAFTSHSLTLSAHPYHSASYKLGFGGLMRSDAHTKASGRLDLWNTYIKVNGALAWGAYTGAFPEEG